MNVTLNTCPTLASTRTATSIAYMISGADLFNPYEGDATTIALASNFYVTDSAGNKVYFVDSGNGYPTPNGQYHPALSVTVDGRSYHFCSPSCRASFLHQHPTISRRSDQHHP